MNLRPFLFAAVLIPSASFAAVGDPCVVATFEGACNGNKITFCNDTDAAAPVEGEVDCATIGGISGGTCETFSYGVNCAVPDGEACLFDSADGALRLPCSNDSSGCIDGVCEASTSCTPPAEDAEPTEGCAGDLVDFGCTAEGQQFQFSCAIFASISGVPTADITLEATCTEEGTSAFCTGVAAGDACATGFLECAAGLFCNGESDTTFGTCGTTATGEGEGEGEGEDGEGGGRRDDEPAEEEPAGFCSTTGTMDATFGFALLGLVAVRRRRR